MLATRQNGGPPRANRFGPSTCARRPFGQGLKKLAKWCRQPRSTWTAAPNIGQMVALPKLPHAIEETLPVTSPARLRMEHICKRFGPTCALDGVSLEVAPGDVHALVG